MLKKVASFLVISGMLTSCATMTRGTKEALVIETEPAGAKVTVSVNGEGGDRICYTPCSMVLSRKATAKVKIEKEGYQTINATVVSAVCSEGALGMAGNLIAGGVIGAGIDAISGATKCLRPNPLKVKLVPIQESTVGQKKYNLNKNNL